MGIPMHSHKIAAPNARVIVTGRRRYSSSFTDTKFPYER